MNTNISNNIKYIGVNDRDITLFEGQYPIKNGMAYNSYVIFDEKIAVTDTVDKIAKALDVDVRLLFEPLDNNHK